MSSRLEIAQRVNRGFEAWNRARATMGTLALGALLIAIASGIALAAGYDSSKAADSVALLELTSTSGRFLRSMHAWSSHLLLVLAAIHVVEHIASGRVRSLPQGVWLRAVLSIPILLLVTLTGFMLKADAEGQLARQILTGLLERLPLAGKAMASALLGSGENLQITYVHHAATLTVLALAFAFEHSRKLWPSAASTVAMAFTTIALAILAPPALHDGLDPVIKGPWYFVAFQEVLHWLSHPSWIWIPLVAFLALLAVLPRLPEATYRRTCWALAAAALAYVAISLFALAFRGAGWELRNPFACPTASRSSRSPRRAALAPITVASLEYAKLPSVLGRHEGCVACHDHVTGLSASHSPEALGCSSCHLGDPNSADKDRAHSGIVLVPGNLDTAPLSCGRASCHDAIVPRVQGSLMATGRGIVSVDRWAFGEQPTPDGTDDLDHLHDSDADTHLRQLCSNCHLGQLKLQPGPQDASTRGGGCAACHASYPARHDYSKDNAGAFVHPDVSLKIQDDACLGCHSRSGRISLAYSGWWETGLNEADASKLPQGSWRKLPDGRVLQRTTDDAHHAKGMACVDCHTSLEAMGTTDSRPIHEEQATRIRCETCHRTQPTKTVPLGALKAEDRSIVRLRYGDAPPPRYLLDDASGDAIVNALPRDDGTIEIRSKPGGASHIATPPSPACSRLPGHARLSCRSCHEAWTTSCVACHTQADAQGKWTEYDSPPEIGAPTMGILERAGSAQIVPFSPGMIMTINDPKSSPPAQLGSTASALITPKSRFLRAYAPVVPHTTTRQGLSCANCHSDPHALGFGKGKLSADGKFAAAYESSGFDGKPKDAWIGALDGSAGISTRTQARSLTADEQKRILTVGKCLNCHDPAKNTDFYVRFDESLKSMRQECRR